MSALFAVSACINVNKIAMTLASKEKEELKVSSKFKNKFDVCIFVSNEKQKEKGIRLLSAFWQRGTFRVILNLDPLCNGFKSIKVMTDFRNK